MTESRTGRGEFFPGEPFTALKGISDPQEAEQILLDLASAIETDVVNGYFTPKSIKKANEHIEDILNLAIQVSP